MNLNVGKELAALRRMSVGDLRSRYAEVFGETTNTHHKDWLVKRIIWRMQAVSDGEGDATYQAARVDEGRQRKQLYTTLENEFSRGWLRAGRK